MEERALARARGPDDRRQLAPAYGEGHAAQGVHRGPLAVDLGHPVELQRPGVAHDDGTTTSSPARSAPSTWTRPLEVSNRPSRTATRARRPPSRTTSTAYPPPDFPTSAITGTLSASRTP